MAERALPGVEKLGARDGLRTLWLLRKGTRGLPHALELLHARLGDIFRLRLGRFERIVLAHPQALREALVEKRQAFAWRVGDEPVVRLLRRGLLVEDGHTHAVLRRIMDPSNRRKHFLPRLTTFYPLLERLISQWQHGATYDMLIEMRKVALLAFEWVYFSHDLTDELQSLWKPILSAIHYIGPGKWLLLGTGRVPTAIAPLNAHFYRLIRQRRQTDAPPDDMLTHLVQQLEDDEIVRDQMMTMFIAGHDTSTAALAWALYLFGRYPQWQAKVREEIRGHFGDELPPPEKVSELPQLDAFVKESLRLYPPIHAGNRRIVAPVQIMGYDLQPEQKVLLSYYLVQRHPHYWEAPGTFRPERWLESARQTETFSYVPFSGGPRMCIGAPFAQVELRMVLSYLLQRFRFTLLHDVEMHMGATLEPYPYVRMKVEKIS